MKSTDYLNWIGGEGRINYLTTDGWANGKIGIIYDPQNDCVYKFHPHHFENGHLYHDGYDEEKWPIVAVGITAFWLKKHTVLPDIKQLFEEYYQLRLNQYVKSPTTTSFNTKKDVWFATRFHIPQEQEFLRQSQALYEYITVDDQKQLVYIGQLYLSFALEKRFEVRLSEYSKGEEYVQLYAHIMEWASKCVDYLLLPQEMRVGGDPNIKYMPLHINLAQEDLFGIDTMDPSSPIYKELKDNLYHLENIDNRKHYLLSILPQVARFVSAYLNNRQKVDEARFKLKEEDNGSLNECITAFLVSSYSFIHNLAGLALSFQIDVCDIANQCGLFLHDIKSIDSYVDGCYIISKEHARNLLIKIHDEEWLKNQEQIWLKQTYSKPCSSIDIKVGKRIFEFHVNDKLVRNIFNMRFLKGKEGLCYSRLYDLLNKETIKNKKDFARLITILYDNKESVFLGTAMPNNFTDCLTQLSDVCGVPKSSYDDLSLLRGKKGQLNQKYKSFCSYFQISPYKL